MIAGVVLLVLVLALVVRAADRGAPGGDVTAGRLAIALMLLFGLVLILAAALFVSGPVTQS